MRQQADSEPDAARADEQRERGGNLVLNWDKAYTGYRLFTQTNNINIGVSKLLSDWGPAGSGYNNTNGASIPIVQDANAYYRLVYP